MGAKSVRAKDGELTCDTCSIGVWYDVQWNRSIFDGKPLTKHCPIKGKGLLRGTPACSSHKE